jgi:hypothetical protein
VLVLVLGDDLVLGLGEELGLTWAEIESSRGFLKRNKCVIPSLSLVIFKLS